MKKLYGLLVAFFFLCTGSVVAQNIDVAGKVTDPDGAPVQGATIRIAGTKSGLQTQMDGSFKASVKEGTKLTISAIGFETKELPASANMSVTLARDVKGMNEVVVTAIGIRREKRE